MTVYYSRPRLQSLSQGDRLAFVRKFRRISQQELGERIGIRVRARNQICRIERTSRDLRPDRLEKIAEVLNVNTNMLKRWNFENPEDLFYALLWTEALCPDFMFRYTAKQTPQNKTHAFLSERYAEWKKMRRRYLDGRISFEEYWDWKLKREEEA